MQGFQKKYNLQQHEEWIRANNATLTNGQMAKHLGCSITTISQYRCSLGLSKLELEKWTPVQVKWLTYLYTWIGDYEIALLFDEAYPKKKAWTLKHIEKKRNYLSLHRSKEQLKAIKERNKLFGCWMVGSEHAWTTRGRSEEGTVKKWGRYHYVKQKRGYERQIVATWIKHNGKVPAGKIIVRKNVALPEDDITNLEAITREELAKRNSFHRYPIEIKRTIITLNKLQKAIYEKQDN